MKSSRASSDRRLVIQVSADLTQVVCLEGDGEVRALTPKPEDFRPVQEIAVTLREVSIEGEPLRGCLQWITDPGLRLHPTLASVSGSKTVKSLLGGE